MRGNSPAAAVVGAVAVVVFVDVVTCITFTQVVLPHRVSLKSSLYNSSTLKAIYVRLIYNPTR